MLAAVGAVLADAGINIASMALGRERAGRTAVTAMRIDSEIGEDVLVEIASIPGIDRVHSMLF
jgi:D-3-phosphoglycerate dehydrogenase